jgi:pSer/pThr/pTyr-binding forkhead associated (FHA) protein
MKLSLVVQTPGKTEGMNIPITLSQFLIGRDPQCHLRPASALISKRHCAVLVRNGKVFVRDFDSTNGTFVNDEPVKGEVEVQHQDRLKVGPLSFVVQVEATTPVNQPTPAPPTKAAAPTRAPGTAKTPPPPTKSPAAAAKTPPPPTKQPAAPAAQAPAAPAAAQQQPPPPKPADTPAGEGNDDDIAAMLLAMGDDGDSAAATGEGARVPDGTTVMEIAAIPPPGEQPPEGEQPKDKMAQTKAQAESTSSAAKSILEKYMRRPRG